MDEILTVQRTRPTPPSTIVIFGASGDLARRKLLPALYNLVHCGGGMMPPNSAILGFARTPMSQDEFRKSSLEAVRKYSRLKVEDECWTKFSDSLDYLGALAAPDGMKQLRERLEQIENARALPPNRVFYLSIPPEAVGDSVARLADAGLIAKPDAPHFSRVVVEKPIGHDLPSALEINRVLLEHLDESQVFRIDHYLGKETVQNLMVLRFANSIFEDFWSNRRIDHVQITVAEEEGVGTRAGYYDSAGALRDIVQNHILQLMSLTAMEPPTALSAEGVNDAKVNVLRTLRPMSPGAVRRSVVRAQYGPGTRDGQALLGYREEHGVRAGSHTETFVALKALIDNWRWAGVPFYLRTGRCMPRRSSSIFIQFKPVPEILFNRGAALPPDVMTIRIQPDEGFSLDVLAKRPDLDLTIQPVRMDLHYASQFNGPSPDAYERLLHDVMAGDQTLFLDDAFIRKSWEFVQGILDQWETLQDIPLETYAAGTWGPAAADELIRADGRQWYEP
ncbi:MAG TPA: glucose-6-phosphate dehydrogenase [Candidatus Binataceae bacterium]|nr:glucose-6-phosphate dehydrogenase [Candidatus Binataceae bacterium]